jgi:hypothetical protein
MRSDFVVTHSTPILWSEGDRHRLAAVSLIHLCLLILSHIDATRLLRPIHFNSPLNVAAGHAAHSSDSVVSLDCEACDPTLEARNQLIY